MIEKVHIENFKSIRNDTINLKNFTVLIGANGSGKSNFIKALEFLSAIPTTGLQAAVSRFGGFAGIVPKAIQPKEMKSSRIKFNYSVILPNPSYYRDDFPHITVDHEFELGYLTRESVRVIKEKIVFHQVLGVADAEMVDNEDDISEEICNSKSTFTLKLGVKGGVSFEAHPPLSSDLKRYLEWFGLTYVKGVTASDIAEFIPAAGRRIAKSEYGKTSYRKNSKTFLDPDTYSILKNASQATVFKNLLKATQKYDFSLNVLRSDQPTSESSVLSSSGLNMPSVLRHISTDPGWAESFNRIMSTFGTIAPHVISASAKYLRTGREFVEFMESSLIRGVESWESSDGSLKALAILLAVETTPPLSTILIEEPEQNLHPWAVRSIIEHIRGAVKERGLQVIIATHSQQVLEMVAPDEVFVVTRTGKDGTKLIHLPDLVPRKNIEMGEVGELWVKGLLGGVPSDD